MRRRLNRIVASAALLTCAPALHAQDAAPPPIRHPGEDLTVYLITIGQGDEVWEQFGHNTIWIRDATTRTTISYNYGIFDFDQPAFVQRLMSGRMLYSMAALDADAELAHYQEHNRTVWSQRLNLTPEQKYSLRQFLEWNWLPENKDYLYHYFYDNCSTRVRDALDRAVGGAIRNALAGRETGTTYRWHSLRLTGRRIPVYAGITLGLGRPTDRPIDAWEESFIPMELMAHARSVRVPGPDGALVPLVAEERTLFEATRLPEAAAPPSRWLAFLLVSSALGAGIVLLARLGRTSRRSALAAGIALSTWGVLAGFFGLLLTLLWVATDHNTSYSNQNLLQVNPLGFLLAVAAPLALLGRTERATGRVARLAWPTALALLALSLAGLLLRLIPGVAQVNGPIIALALPLHVATVLSLYQSLDPEPSEVEDVSARMTSAAAA